MMMWKHPQTPLSSWLKKDDQEFSPSNISSKRAFLSRCAWFQLTRLQKELDDVRNFINNFPWILLGKESSGMHDELLGETSAMGFLNVLDKMTDMSTFWFHVTYLLDLGSVKDI